MITGVVCEPINLQVTRMSLVMTAKKRNVEVTNDDNNIPDEAFARKILTIVKSKIDTPKIIPASEEMANYNPGTCIRLDNNFTELGVSADVFNRKCYGMIITKIKGYNKRSFICTGLPGVGKSSAIISVLKHLVYELGENVYVECENRTWKYFDGKKKTVKNENCWVLLDGSVDDKFIGRKFRTIAFCSPQKRNYQRFQKSVDAPLVYVPPWSKEEVTKFINAMTDKSLLKEILPRLKVMEKFDLVGDVLRSIFSKSISLKQFKTIIERKVMSANLRELGVSADVFNRKFICTGSPWVRESSAIISVLKHLVYELRENVYVECENRTWKYFDGKKRP
ncbi:hypothetical protein O9G_004887 [Rozella allomycis CSF55]|uniref:Uncharacterized protein n=1 Tax=Rozella allomycis (strain CSF55) TaxID=988480 RepID=A0A075AMG0_ROZAC|nr:hypothetical protein O9G_004887 [Rozella allomycis CSF55]|eukprot:EPZ30773.1 hypothetical protein O9G_004887 [Rozella allomycis CSF55]